MLEEEYKVDKASWGDGPWMQEPDKLVWKDEATGFDCMIVRGPVGSLCGYVGVKPEHPTYERHYNDVSVDVHGGLTYSEKCGGVICHPVEEGEDDVWWLGFDCGHLGDLSPGYPSELDMLRRGAVYRDIAYVREEIGSLAEQLSRATLHVELTPITE